MATSTSLVQIDAQDLYGKIMLNGVLKNVMSAANAMQNSTKKGEFLYINEHFEENFNVVAASAIVFQGPVNAVLVIDGESPVDYIFIIYRMSDSRFSRKKNLLKGYQGSTDEKKITDF